MELGKTYTTFKALWNKEYKQWFLPFDKNRLFTIFPLLPCDFKEYDLEFDYEYA